MSIDADTGLQIDPDENIPRLDVSGVADVIGYTDFDNFNMPIGSGLFDESGNVNLDFISSLTNDPAIFNAFTEFDPEAAAELRRLVGAGGNTRSFGGDQSGIATLDLGNVGGASTAGRDEVELAGPNYGDPNKILEQIDIDDSSADAASGVYDPNDQSAAETARLQRQANLTASGQNAVANIGPQGDTGVQSQSADKTGLAKILDDAKKGFKDLTGLDAGDAAKYAAMLAIARMAYNDAQEAREEARGWSAPGGYAKQAVRSPGGGVTFKPAGKAAGGIASLAGGGIASLAGGGETFQMTDYGSDPRNKEVNWAKLQEDRVRMPEAFEGVLQNLNLNNIPSLYSEIPRSQEELKNRDYELYAYYGLPDLASNPPNEYLTRTIDDIRNALNVGSIPNREQISMIEANQLYDPVGSASASETPQFNEEPKLYESNNFTSELSGDLNPAFERALRNWEQTGRWGGGGGEFGKGTGLDFEMSMYSNGGMTTKQPFYLGGITDGMADKIPAHIDNKRPAALSDGEFVIPADVVSHLGNGNSNAGAKRLYEMMDRIREARTGNSKQGIQVNPNNFMPG